MKHNRIPVVSSRKLISTQMVGCAGNKRLALGRINIGPAKCTSDAGYAGCCSAQYAWPTEMKADNSSISAGK